MCLYLEIQIRTRALEVHNSFENIEIKKEERAEKHEAAKTMKFAKKMKKLQREVRSSLYQKDNSVHEHEFGSDECVNEDEDLYKKTCISCGHN